MTKSNRQSIVFITLLGLHTSAAYSQALDNACATLITSGLREYSVDIESDSYLETIFRRHCEKSGEVKKSSFGLGLDTVVEAIPLELKVDSANSRESMTNFCKNYAKVEQRSKHIDKRTEKIVREAYRSFDACMVMAASGVIVRHEIRSFNDVDFFISPNYNGRIAIKGIQTPQHVTCRGQKPNPDASKSAAAETFDINTAIVLNPTQSLNIACVRTGRDAPNGGGTVFDEAAITVLTDIRPEGNYSAYMPPDSKIPETQASVLAQQMNTLEKQNTELRKILDEEKDAFLSGTTVVGSINGHDVSELNVYIPFKNAEGEDVELRNVPHVVAVVDKWKAQSRVYWTVNITEVTTKGFKARIFSVEKMAEPNYGWSHAAAVQWMAYARPKSGA